MSRLRYFCIIPSAWLPFNGGSGAPIGATVSRTIATDDGPVVETRTLPGGFPAEAWEAFVTPGDPTRAVMVIESWHCAANEDSWRATPGVISLPELWDWGRAVPPLAVTMFGPWGVLPTDTMGEAARKIRAYWPRLRH